MLCSLEASTVLSVKALSFVHLSAIYNFLSGERDCDKYLTGAIRFPGHSLCYSRQTLMLVILTSDVEMPRSQDDLDVVSCVECSCWQDDKLTEEWQISINLRNAQAVWGLQSSQYRACEAILVEYLQENSKRDNVTAVAPNSETVERSAWNLPLRPAK